MRYYHYGDLTDYGYHEVEVSLILVLHILESFMLQTKGLQQDDPLLIFARFLGKVRIESCDNNPKRNVLTKKYADEMLAPTLRNRLTIGIGHVLSSTVHQIAITYCQDRPMFTILTLLWLRQPHIHYVIMTTLASQYLTESLTTFNGKGTVSKTFRVNNFVIPGQTVTIDEKFNHQKPEDVFTVIRELFNIASTKQRSSPFLVWNKPTLLAYIANMTAVQHDLPPYPGDSTHRSQSSNEVVEKGLWALRCLIIRDIDYFHNNMVMRAMGNVPSFGDFVDGACEFVCHNVPSGTFTKLTPRAVAVVFNPAYDFGPLKSTSAYPTLRSFVLPLVAWYMLVTFGVQIHQYSPNNLEDDVIDALRKNNNLCQLPEQLTMLIWGKDFNIFQVGGGATTTSTTTWDICANPSKDAVDNNAGAPRNFVSLPRPASQGGVISSIGVRSSNKAKKATCTKRKAAALLEDDHHAGEGDDVSSDDYDYVQEEEEELKLNRSNTVTTNKRKKQHNLFLSQDDQEAELDENGIYNDIIKYV